MTKKQKNPNPYLKFTTIAFQMGATIWLGNYCGNWLDAKYQTTHWENTITLLAVFASIYLVINQVIKMSKRHD